ncbi:hypothetical protein [Paracoccus marinaquae]|uniref:Uncharacterized protein n=1 Tax=Paracoccus marinaquae TaxID=2841926 RepID=A0ABS6AF76_9RHOB|nr:hypothetical protein [Paracoccus marinaquae]MBU3029178.1 hypothetical protein [Paracoccus marinaquae]
MLRRILAAFALVPLTALPVLAQQVEAPKPVPAPAPAVQTAPAAGEVNQQSQPELITPARKSNCSHARQVTS